MTGPYLTFLGWFMVALGALLLAACEDWKSRAACVLVITCGAATLGAPFFPALLIIGVATVAIVKGAETRKV